MKIFTRALLISAAAIIAGFLVWFAFFLKPEITVDAAMENEIVDLAASKDVVIIFNSGGWGNTPLQAAADFAPIIDGITESLGQLGYSAAIAPFVRTPKGLLGKIEDSKDWLASFDYSSEALAAEVEYIQGKLPGKPVIMAGLSNGGGLTEKAMARLAGRPAVYAIVAGVPRWNNNYRSDDLLVLDNAGRDTMSAGNLWALAGAVVKAPFKWFRAKLDHQELSFALAIEIPGHEYAWSSPLVGPPVVAFINNHFEVNK